MRMFFGVMLVTGALLLFSCSSSSSNSSDSSPTPTPTETLTWDTPDATWDNVKWK